MRRRSSASAIEPRIEAFHNTRFWEPMSARERSRTLNLSKEDQMKAAHALTFAVALAGTAFLSLPVSAVEVCDKSCVGPACAKDCVREPNATVGRKDRDEVIVKERERRGPDVKIEERERRPGVDVE